MLFIFCNISVKVSTSNTHVKLEEFRVFAVDDKLAVIRPRDTHDEDL